MKEITVLAAFLSLICIPACRKIRIKTNLRNRPKSSRTRASLSPNPRIAGNRSLRPGRMSAGSSLRQNPTIRKPPERPNDRERNPKIASPDPSAV